MHRSLPCPSLWWHHLDLKTNIYGYISIFPRQHLIQISIIYTHTHIHTPIIYISTYYYACQHKNMLHPPQEGSDRIFDIWHTSGCLMVDVPCLDDLWDGQKDYLDVGQVRCFHEETSRITTFLKGDTKESDRIPVKKILV